MKRTVVIILDLYLFSRKEQNIDFLSFWKLKQSPLQISQNQEFTFFSGEISRMEINMDLI